MSAIHGVEGLIKWIKGDEWRNDFEAVRPPCRPRLSRRGVELEELADIIGDHGMTVLWGCAFEDFVSSGAGERNVADEYLKRRGWKESAGARAYIRALRTSVMSLYEVSDVVVGESFLARDLVRGGEPVRVFERSATRSLSQWGQDYERRSFSGRRPVVHSLVRGRVHLLGREQDDSLCGHGAPTERPRARARLRSRCPANRRWNSRRRRLQRRSRNCPICRAKAAEALQGLDDSSAASPRRPFC